MTYRKVEDSIEAAIGAGILSAILEQSYSSRILKVECDPSQVGAEAEIFVHMRGKPTDVILRLHVTEVVPE